MSDRLDVRIITPDRVVYKSSSDSLIIPGTMGEMEILPGHVALFSTIQPGEIRIKEGDQDLVYACGAGLLEVCADRVTLLVDSAAGSREIDPREAAKLVAEAEDKLKNLSSEDEEERFAFETQLAAAKARIEVYERTSGEHVPQHGFSRISMEPINKEGEDTSAE